MATRTVGVFAHRLYGAITTAHYTAKVVPFVRPETVVRQSQFFGPSLTSMPIHDDRQLPPEADSVAGPLRTLRNLGVFGVNLVGLIAGAKRDTSDFVADVEWLEARVAEDVSRIPEPRLQSLILLARDHVIDGWVLAYQAEKDIQLSLIERSCNVAPLSKCSMKIWPMLRVQAIAVTEETTSPMRAPDGTT